MGKTSKQEQAAQMRERKLQLQREEEEKRRRQNRLFYRTLLIGLAAVLLLSGVIVGVNACKNANPVIDAVNPNYQATEDVTDYVRLTVTYTDGNDVYRQGEIIMQLRPDVAPITVQNFKELVARDFYNGLTFHRVISGFMIQGGDPKGDGTGDSGKNIVGEFESNGHPNSLSHKRGVVSMARGGYDPDSASCQFFIVHEDSSSSLDGDYAAFGEVVSGMATVDGIATTKVTRSGQSAPPVKPVTIVKAEFVQKIA